MNTTTFPQQHCIPTKYLTYKSYCDLMCKLVSEGNIQYSNMDWSNTFDLYQFVGLSHLGDISLFDNDYSFTKEGWNPRKKCDNVLSKEWLDNYLGGM